jgi:predicted amidohydrolase
MVLASKYQAPFGKEAINDSPKIKGNIRIASYQGRIYEDDINANFEIVKRTLADLATEELDFLCFPESFLTGASPTLSLSLDDKRIQDLIKEIPCGTALIVGLTEDEGDGLYNTAVVLRSDGIVGKQRKTLLCEDEAQVLKIDHSLRVFEHSGVTFGIVICHTTSFIEPALCLRLMGAQLLFTPHYNCMEPNFEWIHREMVLNNHVGIACLLKVTVVRSNIIKINKDGIGYGDSNIWSRDGFIIGAGIPSKEMIVIAEIPLEDFVSEAWINRNEVPDQLYREIARLGVAYNKAHGVGNGVVVQK